MLANAGRIAGDITGNVPSRPTCVTRNATGLMDSKGGYGYERTRHEGVR
jgi:hypothetical protein